MPAKIKPRPTPADLPLDDLPRLTVSAAVELTNSSRATVYRMIRDGRLPAYRFGQQLRFRASDLVRLFEAVDQGAA